MQGVRTKHAIDVHVKSHHLGFDVVWIVECKYWNTPVSKLHVLALREIVADLGADRGILLCEVGFQSGAFEAATLTNVHLTSLATLRGTASLEITAMRLRDLDWNQPSIEFYKKLGAVPMDEWTKYRLDGESLAQLAHADNGKVR